MSETPDLKNLKLTHQGSMFDLTLDGCTKVCSRDALHLNDILATSRQREASIMHRP
jgi:hypothetical protein